MIKSRKFIYANLSDKEKLEYLQIALRVYGEPDAYVVSTWEPIYFNDDATVNPVHIFITEQMNVLHNMN